MVMIETQIKKWGNSYGMILPKDIFRSEKLKVNQKIEIILVKDAKKILKETFGIGKGILKKSGQEIKDELRKELHD